MNLSEIDQVLIRYADTMSPQALSFKIKGMLTPEQVMTRIAHLTDAPDWLSATRQDQLVTLRMRQIVAELEELPRTTRNAEVILKGLEAIGARLDRREAANEQDLSKLYAFQGVVMLEAVNAALTHMRSRLTSSGHVAQEEWDSALESGIQYAQMEISKHEQED